MIATATIDLGDAVKITAAPPTHISQHNVLATLGLKRRAFLETLPSYRAAGGAVISVGRTRIVAHDAYVKWLAHRDADHGDSTDDASRLAEAAGLRLIGGAAE